MSNDKTILLKNLGLNAEQIAAVGRLMGGGPGRVTFKVSAKGAVSIYGIGRSPVTLYLSQLRALRDSNAIENAIAFGESHGAREKGE